MELLSPMSGPGSLQVRRSGSFRRSRNSPSASPSIAAERELSAFLGMTTPTSKNGLELEQNVRETRAQKGDASIRTDPPPAQTPAQNSHHATSSYLSSSSSPAQRDSLSPSNGDKTTSDGNQHSDPNNNGDDLPADSGLTEVEGNGEEKLAGATTGSMSVLLEKCSLVPQLKAFDVVNQRPHSGRRRGRDQDDLVVTNLDEPIEQIHGEQNSHAEECPVQVLLPEGTAKEEEREDQVIVWCVTGVCEIAADLTHPQNTDPHTASEQPHSRCGGSSPETAAQENLLAAPISNQPVSSASHFDDAPPPLAEPTSESDKVPTRGGSAGAVDQKGRTKVSSNRSREANSMIPGQKASSSSSSHRGIKSLASTRTSKEFSSSAGTKPRAVRTLTTSENQDMRRVVPISRSSRGATSQVKHLEKPLWNHRGSSTTTARPATAPSSRRSSFNKVLDTKDPKEPKVPSVRSQNTDPRKPPSVRKPSTKPAAKPEEKMCRSTLRALTQGAGGGGSVSAPSTPLHKAAGSSSLPGFARSTASFSFRRSQTALPPSKAAPDSSSRILHPKTTSTTSSVTPPIRPRAGSLRASQSSQSHNSSSSGPSWKLQSGRLPAQSPHPELLGTPKGHRRNDSGTLSDKSTHSQSESLKSNRPSWR